MTTVSNAAVSAAASVLQSDKILNMDAQMPLSKMKTVLTDVIAHLTQEFVAEYGDHVREIRAAHNITAPVPPPPPIPV
jgi:hypothetical protein